MIVEEGDQILACYRRSYEQEAPRFFAGKVIESNDAVVKISGFTFVRNPNTGRIERKDEHRTMFISIISGMHLLYQLPDGVSVDALRFIQEKGHLLLTDHAEFQMNINE